MWAVIYWLLKEQRSLSSWKLVQTETVKAVNCFIGAFGSRVGWGRECQCAHAHSVGNAIENGELCRAVQKSSWKRPLGTRVGVPEDSPGDCRTDRLLTGTNSESFPGDNLLLRPRRRQRRERSKNPLLLPVPSPLFCFRQRKRDSRDSGDVAAKRLGFALVLFAWTHCK